MVGWREVYELTGCFGILDIVDANDNGVFAHSGKMIM